MKDLLIIGTGGHARTVVDTAQLLSYNLAGCIDINYSGKVEDILGVPVIGGFEKLKEYSCKYADVFVAIGDNHERSNIIEKVRDLGYMVVQLVHPTAIISSSSAIDSGSLICAGAILNAGVKIGVGCIINTGAIVDHESTIDDYTHIAPGVNIAGRVKIGARSFVGIGSRIIDKIEIGNNTVIGAGSIILENVASNTTVVGIHKKLKK